MDYKQQVLHAFHHNEPIPAPIDQPAVTGRQCGHSAGGLRNPSMRCMSRVCDALNACMIDTPRKAHLVDITELALHLIEDHDAQLNGWLRREIEDGKFPSEYVTLSSLEHAHAYMHAPWPRATAVRAAAKRRKNA